MGNLSIYIFFLVVSTTLTGSFVQLIWFAGRKLCGFKNPVVVYHALKVVCVSYIVPVVYIFSWCYYNSFFYIEKESNSFAKFLELIPLVRHILSVLAVIWMCFFFCVLCYRMSQLIKWKLYIKWNRQETRAEIVAKMEECQKKLHVRKKVKIYRKSGLATPLCTGLFSKKILLPEKEYRDQDLEVIFMHELTHIKNHDLEWKWMSVLITMIHCFNPFSYQLLQQISIWNEIGCDIHACEKGKEMFTIKGYYNVILNMMMQNRDRRLNDFIMTALAEKGSDMVIRIQHIKEYKKSGRKRRIMAAAIMTAALTVAFFVSYHSVTNILNAYDMFINNNFFMKWENRNFEEETIQTIEQIADYHDENWIEKKAEESRIYKWNLKAGNTYEIKEIDGKEGSRLKVYCYLFYENNKDIIAGIIEPEGTVRSVKNTKVVEHIFDIKADGEYSIFVKSADDSDIEAYFSYYLQKE